MQPQPNRFHRRPAHGTGVAPASRRLRVKNKSGDLADALYTSCSRPMTKHPHIPELKEPEVPKQSEIYVFDRDSIAAYYKRMPLADGRNRIGQYRAALPKLEPPVPVGSFYMYDDAEGNWLVCQLVGRVRWREEEIARYGPGKKEAALEHLKRLVASGRAGRNRTPWPRKQTVTRHAQSLP